MPVTLHGSFIRYKRRNEKTGYCEFVFQRETVEEGSPYVVMSGVLPYYPKNTPIIVDLKSKTPAPSESGNERGKRKEGENKEVIKAPYTAPLCVGARLYEGNEALLEKFLSYENFPGIGREAARAIINATDGKIFSLETKEDTIISAVKSEAKSVKSEDIKSCLKRLKDLKRFENLYEWLLGIKDEYDSLGGADDYSNVYECAVRAFGDYGINAKDTISKNPYVLLNYEAPLCLAEHLAKKTGIEMCDKKRIRAITLNAMMSFRGAGNTAVSFHSLYRKIRAREERAGGKYKTSALFIAEEVLSDRYKFDEEDLMVSLRDDYLNEKDIASSIRRLRDTASIIRNEMVSVAEVEDITKNAYSKDQKAVFGALDSGGVKCVTGGPGTGKTTLLSGIITKYRIENPTRGIVLCAPTGKAASRMKETTGMQARTIHSLLGIIPCRSKDALPPTNKIDAGLVVVDECSMVDAALMARLLGAISNGTLVILMGDSDQLESIGAGNVFGDIIDSGKVPVYRLTTVHRQDIENPIVKNSRKVIKGDKDLIETEDFKIIRVKNEEELSEKASEYVASLYGKRHDVRCFVPTRKSKFRCGSVRMNESVQSRLMDENTDHVIYGSYRFAKGSPVIFCRNDYDAGYINGQDGVVTDVQRHGETCIITVLSDGETYTLKDAQIRDIELSYSITAHKAQGSETDEAVILVPKNPPSMLLRKLLYVEITRAKRRVVIFSEGGALEEAISDRRECRRSTVLPKLLEEVMPGEVR